MSKTDDAARSTAIGEAAEFLREHGKLNETGDHRSLTQSSYYDLMSAQFALTKPVIQGVAEANKVLANAMVVAGTRDFVPRIEQAKANGEDPNGLTHIVSVAAPSGPISTTIFATRSTPNPTDGTRTDRHGSIKLRIRTNSWLDEEVTENARDAITKILTD